MTKVTNFPLPAIRNWHGGFLALFCGGVGLSGALLPQTRADAVVAAFPAWGQMLWYLGLIACALVGGLAVARSTAAALIWERAAWCALVGLCIGYLVGALIYAPYSIPAALSIGYVLTFVALTLGRVRQIRLILGHLEINMRALAEASGTADPPS